MSWYNSVGFLIQIKDFSLACYLLYFICYIFLRKCYTGRKGNFSKHDSSEHTVDHMSLPRPFKSMPYCEAHFFYQSYNSSSNQQQATAVPEHFGMV